MLQLAYAGAGSLNASLPGTGDFPADNTTEYGQHTVHDQCAGGVRVEHHRFAGRDHWWPSNVGGESTHQVIWDFVSQFRRE